MAQNVTLSPTALTFCVASTASTAPASQAVTVSTGTSGVFFTTGSSQSNWLQVTPGSGTATNTTPVMLTVSITPSQLSPSATTQTGTIQVSSGGGLEVDTVQVTVQIGQSGCTPSQGGTLTPTTTLIALSSTVSSAQLSLSGSGTVTYSASGSSPLFFTINGSTNPGTVSLPLSAPLTIAFNPNVSSTSSYSGAIVFTQGSTQATVNVTYTPSGGGGGTGVLSATPPSVALTPAASSASITVNGSGNADSITTSAQGGVQWFAISGNNISLSSGTNVPLPESLGVQLTNLADTTKNYTGTITVTQGSTVLLITVTYAGNGTITATPSPIALTYAAPTANLSLTGTGPVTIQASFGSSNPANWFTVAGTNNGNLTLSGTTQLPVSFNSNAASASNSYSGGQIVITPQGGTPVYVGVTYTGGSGGSGGNGSATYDTAPNFTISSGTTATQTQYVNVSGLNYNVPTTVSLQTSVTWLQVGTSAVSGNPNPISVTVYPSGLTAGTYTDNIYVNQNGITVLTIPVTVTVGGTPTLTVTPSTLSFVYQLGGTAPSAQYINVSSASGSQVSFTPSASTNNCGNWLYVPASGIPSLTTGTTVSQVSVQINTAVLSSSTTSCTGNVQIYAPGASNPTSNVTVSLTVSTTPLFQASPASVAFTAQSTTTVPASIQVLVSSTGSALPFTYAVNPSSAGGVVFASVAASATTTNSTLTVSVIPSVFASLTPGAYTNSILLTSTASGNPTTLVIPITLTVGTTLTANPTALVFNYQIGNIQPPSQTISVSSTGAPIDFTASVTSSTCSNIISVSPTSGTSVQSLGQTGTTLTVQANNLTGFFTTQTCTAVVNILASNSSTPVAVNVTVNIVNTAVINVTPQSIVQVANASSPAAQTTQVTLSSSDNGFTQISFTATGATNPAGQTWLTVTPNSGVTQNTLQIRTDPTGLAPGTYTGAISINSPTSVPVETIPVTLIVTAQATLSTSSLSFSMPQGGSNPASQTITIGGVPSTTNVSASATATTCASGWLTASTSGTVVTVGVNGSSLTQGTCTGTVNIFVPGATNSPLSVPVTLTVASAIPLTLSTSSLTFNANLGATTAPSSQTVQLSAAANATVTFAATATTTSGGNWLTVSPTSGATPSTLTVSIVQSVLSGLSAGTYTGAVTITSPTSSTATITVTLIVTATPPPAVTTITNAATQLPGAVAPGELVTLYGTNLGPSPALGLQLTSNGTVATTLGNVQVMFDSTAAPLLYVGPNQINAVVPYEVAGRVHTVITVINNGLVSTGIDQSVATTSPGIFTANSSGSGPGAILNQDYSYNTVDVPANKGSAVSVYATGAGQLSPPATTGSVTPVTPPFALASSVTATFQVTQNGSTTTIPANVLYAGAAPGFISGLIQVNVVIPATIPSGAQTIILGMGPNSSPATVTVQVK